MCSNADILSVFRYIKIGITIIKIVVPLILIISLMITYTKAVSSGDNDALAKANKSFTSKVIAAILIFFIPTFVNVLAGMAAFESNEYLSCISNATIEGIDNARKNESLKRIEEVENTFSRNSYNVALSTINKIKNESTKNDLLSELESQKKYVDITEALNTLRNNKSKANVTKATELIEALPDSDPYKSKFKETLKEIGVGVPLNVEAGYHEFYYGNMRYYLYFPPDATTNMPLLLWLHGDNYREQWAKNVGFCKTAYKAGYPIMVLVPFVGPTMGHQVPGWAEGGLIPTVKQIVDEVCNKYECDREKIDIGGHSRGAIGTWKMVSDYPNFFHAAAPVSCCSFSGLTPSSFTGMKVWAVRGSGAGQGYENDDNYSCMGSDVEKVKKYAKQVNYVILPHTKHSEATDDLQSSVEFIKFMFDD